MAFKTADGLEFETGSLLFSHYTMTPLVVGRGETDEESSFHGWFECAEYQLPDVTEKKRRATTLLNGERLCSLEHGVRMGWISAEQVSRFRLEHQCPECWDAPCRCTDV